MEKRINDFSIRVATVNGTGSQSSNNILFKTLFRMGIGVCGKNMFPSNIQGLPTWFQIRVSPEGYQDLREKDDVAVLMNKDTAAQDMETMGPGSTIFYNSSTIKIEPDQIKDGMTLYPIPVEELAKQIMDAKLRTLLKNLFYVGVLTVLFNLEKEVVEGVIRDTFKKKQKAIDLNINALEIGMNYAKENLEKKDIFEFQRSNVNDGKIILDGNSASGLGCVYGGCTVVGWYPITPSSSLAEAFIAYSKKFRHDEEGKAKYAIVQAEDELASAGIVIGAGWAGARSMTSTSGPGISLMNEFIGLAYYTEIPGVFFDIQRVGPSTGLPTRTQQCDTLECVWASHGDTKHIALFPSTINECFELSQEAFNLSERFQTPVFVVSDLDLGMNNWVADELEYKEIAHDRGKILTAAELDKVKDWGRYKDIDGDGIPYRTLPGTEHPNAAYFTRGSGHDEYAKYSESPVVYTKNMDRLKRKWETAKKFVPKPIFGGDPKGKIGIIAYGTTHHAVEETLDRMKDTSIRYMKLLAYPFGEEVEGFIKDCDQVYVVEQNRDAQLLTLINTDLPGYQDKMKSILYYGGYPLSADVVERKLKEHL